MCVAEEDHLGLVLHPMHMRPHLSVLKSDNICCIGLMLSQRSGAMTLANTSMALEIPRTTLSSSSRFSTSILLDIFLPLLLSNSLCMSFHPRKSLECQYTHPRRLSFF